MPTGLFKTSDQSVQVDYDGVSSPIPRSTYENNGYKIVVAHNFKLTAVDGNAGFRQKLLGLYLALR
jgi:hypothetical protein